MAYQTSYSQPGYPGQPTQSDYSGHWQAPSPGYPSQPPAPGYPVHHHPPYFSGSAPPPGPPPQSAPPPRASAGASSLATTGQLEGVQFRIDHRDSNSMLYLRLQPGAEVKAKSGGMVAMDATVKIRGKLKFSMAKFLSGGNVRTGDYVGRRGCI